MANLPNDYLERTYAAVLGKVVGVFMGRPFEGWTHEKIAAQLGPVWHYVNEKVNKPLIVADDDISGTFTFVRALDDYDPPAAAKAGAKRSADDTSLSELVGKTWLNYIINLKSILWWGGIGRSTEHTAYARLAAGVPAPRSGSIELNGPIVAQQIGAQIFIDAWGMVAPGDPERAAWLAGQAGSVSHDGESVYAAQVVAALISLAYVEPSMQKMLDGALSLIPADALIRKIFGELAEIRAKSESWLDAYNHLLARYGYDKFKGACHVIPNHALILMTLLYAPDSFQTSQMIINTAGWDTDCNAANVGAIMGAHLGLAAFEEGVDYLGPMRDQLYVPTSDGGRCATDAAHEALAVANRGRALAGLEPIVPKEGARYHFALPKSMHGFHAMSGPDWTPQVSLANVEGHSSAGARSLEIAFEGAGLGRGIAVVTETFPPDSVFNTPGYAITASPSVYSGQTIRARVTADFAGASGPLSLCMIAELCVPAGEHGEKSATQLIRSSSSQIADGGEVELSWQLPDSGGYPIGRIGIEARAIGDEEPGVLGSFAAAPAVQSGSDAGVAPGSGALYLDYLRVDGSPRVALHKPAPNMQQPWFRQWVAAVDKVETWRPNVGLVQHSGTGTFTTGTFDWSGYQVSAVIKPAFFTEGGIAIHVRGLKHYLAAVLRRDRTAALLEVYDEVRELATAPLEFAWETPIEIEVSVADGTLRASFAGTELSAQISEPRLVVGGGTGFVVTEGTIEIEHFAVEPVE